MPNASRPPVAMASLIGNKLAPAGSRLVLAEWTIPGRAAGEPEWMAPLHLHHDDDEAWYVLEGALRVRVGDSDHEVPAGGAVVGPHGIPHTFGNAGPEPARYVIIMSDRTSALLDELHSGRHFELEEMRKLYAAYGCELLV